MSKLIMKKSLKYIFVIMVIISALLFGKKEHEVENGNDPLKAPSIQNEIKPEIDRNQKDYRLNNFLNSRKNDYYRLTFKWRSNHNSIVSATLVSKFGGKQRFFSESLSKSKDYAFKEVLFKSDDLYKDLLFEKDDKEDLSEIFIKDIQISRLNVNSESELSQLKSVTYGNTNIIDSVAKQTNEWSSYFSQLRESGTIVGQIFKAEDELLGGVSFIIRKNGNGSNKYRLELREVSQKKDDIFLSSDMLSFKDFTTGELANYTDDSGITFFPLVSSLKKGQLYFIGIDNSIADNKDGYIELKGTQNKNAYPYGNAVAQHKNKINDIGDLFFTISTPVFNQVNKERVLTDARIEDLGEGKVLYEYRSRGIFTDVLDLFYYDRKNVWFNDYEGIISGSPRDDSNYVYKIYVPYSIKQVRIMAEQMYAGWYRAIVSYSFDNQNWTDLPYSGEGKNDSVQKFNSVIAGNENERYLYVKVTYDKFDNKEVKLFGLRNFKIIAELTSR